MNTEELLLLTWLHNIYLKPSKISVRIATSKFINALHDGGYVEFSSPPILYPKVIITAKGKSFLKKNIHLLTPEDENIGNVI